MLISQKGPCRKRSQEKLNSQNLSVRFSTVNLFPGTAYSTRSSSLALVQKHSSPSSCLLLIPPVWCLLTLEILQDLYLENLYLFWHIHKFFHHFLDWFYKSCEVMHNIWTVFSNGNLFEGCDKGRSWWFSQLFFFFFTTMMASLMV